LPSCLQAISSLGTVLVGGHTSTAAFKSQSNPSPIYIFWLSEIPVAMSFIIYVLFEKVLPFVEFKSVV